MKIENLTFQVTAAAGIESLTARELRDLNFQNVRIDDRSRIFFDGNFTDMMRANLWLRTADRVKIVMGEFQAKTFETLFDQVYTLNWEDFIPLGAKFPVAKAKSVKSQLHNEPSVQSITKKAIVKKLQEVYHRPENQALQETGPEYRIEIALNKDFATLTIDTTGDSLFKRGYRQEHGGAPLKENFAAALVLMTNWLVNPTRPFVDITCGSGTIVLEAAMAALHMAPGLHRHFAFENWTQSDLQLLSELKIEAQGLAKRDLSLDITGIDNDPQMIAISRRNTLALGLENVVKYKEMRLQDFTSAQLDGVIVSNPPYGERLLEQEEAQALYQEMGEALRPLKTWSKYILTSNESFEALYGAKANKKRKLYNGTLRTDYYQFFGERPKKD
ncbi:MAG: class I SAM-dependent RNA methyltransferase [Streptococcaceae bacterium]|jgi:putative N6-adenine-specific DNA methylase|nr:class I SAM-dependent RNA methyltransferase [Streptococcaceae bacterium]